MFNWKHEAWKRMEDHGRQLVWNATGERTMNIDTLEQTQIDKLELYDLKLLGMSSRMDLLVMEMNMLSQEITKTKKERDIEVQRRKGYKEASEALSRESDRASEDSVAAAVLKSEVQVHRYGSDSD